VLRKSRKLQGQGVYKHLKGIALFQLAKLYDALGQQDKAVKCFEENLKRKDEEQIVDKEQGECLLYLTK